MIELVVCEGGKRTFPAAGALRALRLADRQVTTTGAILATYAREIGLISQTETMERSWSR